MKLSILHAVAKKNFFTSQLFNLQRCFGSHSLYIVTDSGSIRIQSVADLIKAGECSKRLAFLDNYLPNVPRVCYVANDENSEFNVPKVTDEPKSPWEIAQLESELAKERCRIKREKAKNDC